MADLAVLEKIPGVFGTWGLAHSVNMQTRVPSPAYLSLDPTRPTTRRATAVPSRSAAGVVAARVPGAP
jgi:hypothetical protein